MGFEKQWDSYQIDLIPVEYKIVVLPDLVNPMAGDEGLIKKPDQTADQEQWAQTRGTLIAVSEMAFTDSEGQKWPGVIPKPGDRIYYGKYAGIETDILGDNSVNFRVMNDKDICAIVRKVTKQ